MMKCKEFEFEFVVAPNEVSAEANEHRLACVACQAFAEQHQGVEQQLAELINCEVPAGLRDSLRQQRGKSAQSSWRMPVISLSLAASFFVAMLSFNLYTSEQPGLPIDRLLVEHFEHDGARSMKARLPTTKGHGSSTPPARRFAIYSGYAAGKWISRLTSSCIPPAKRTWWPSSRPPTNTIPCSFLLAAARTSRAASSRRTAMGVSLSAST